MVCEDSGPEEILIFFVSEAALCEDRCFLMTELFFFAEL